MTKQRQHPRTGWAEWLSRTAQDIVVSVVAAGLVSAGFLYYFEIRLENSKDRVAVLMATEQRFDASHNDVVVQLGLYANELLSQKNDPELQDRILRSIITTQLQVLQLRNLLGKDDPAIRAYDDELSRLSAAVRAAHSAKDLGVALSSVQPLLDAHKQLTASLRNKSEIRAFE